MSLVTLKLHCPNCGCVDICEVTNYLKCNTCGYKGDIIEFKHYYKNIVEFNDKIKMLKYNYENKKIVRVNHCPRCGFDKYKKLYTGKISCMQCSHIDDIENFNFIYKTELESINIKLNLTQKYFDDKIRKIINNEKPYTIDVCHCPVCGNYPKYVSIEDKIKQCDICNFRDHEIHFNHSYICYEEMIINICKLNSHYTTITNSKTYINITK